MAATIIDSRIFGNIFSTEAMRRVWSDENRTQKYLDIEAALARVQGRLGIIPQEAADEPKPFLHARPQLREGGVVQFRPFSSSTKTLRWRTLVGAVLWRDTRSSYPGGNRRGTTLFDQYR